MNGKHAMEKNLFSKRMMLFLLLNVMFTIYPRVFLERKQIQLPKRKLIDVIIELPDDSRQQLFSLLGDAKFDVGTDIDIVVPGELRLSSMFGNTPLKFGDDLIEQCEMTLLMKLLTQRSVDSILFERLLAEGVNINAISCRLTPLILAITSSKPTKIIKALLDAGAEVNALTFREMGRLFALRCAVQQDNVETMELLLNAGADVNLGEGVALRTAVAREKPSIAHRLINAGADVNMGGPNKFTPLMAAAGNGNYGMAKMLIKLGADVNAVDYYGITALMYAACKNHDKIIDLLLMSGALLNVDAMGWVPTNALREAAANGHRQLVNDLIARGARVGSVASLIKAKTREIRADLCHHGDFSWLTRAIWCPHDVPAHVAPQAHQDEL